MIRQVGGGVEDRAGGGDDGEGTWVDAGVGWGPRAGSEGSGVEREYGTYGMGGRSGRGGGRCRLLCAEVWRYGGWRGGDSHYTDQKMIGRSSLWRGDYS